jgi:hypothetical protein
MRTRPVLAVTALAATAALSATALASPSSAGVGSVSRSGSTVTASGTAAFGALTGPVSVGGTNTEFPQADVASAAGVDLVDARIGPLANGSGLRFTWQLRHLPSVVPPEGARYTWSFKVGEAVFQLQAKRSNIASVTLPDDPAGHVAAAAAGSSFQLRGNCSDTYQGTVPLANCPHLRFLTGGFDPATDTVTMDVPFGAAPEIVRGAAIVEAQAATMSIAAGPQAVASTAAASDYTNGWTTYYAGPSVGLATGAASANPRTLNYAAASLQDGAWSGTLTKVPAAHTTLFVRTCQGLATDCQYTSAPLS